MLLWFSSTLEQGDYLPFLSDLYLSANLQLCGCNNPHQSFPLWKLLSILEYRLHLKTLLFTLSEWCMTLTCNVFWGSPQLLICEITDGQFILPSISAFAVDKQELYGVVPHAHSICWGFFPDVSHFSYALLGGYLSNKDKHCDIMNGFAIFWKSTSRKSSSAAVWNKILPFAITVSIV